MTDVYAISELSMLNGMRQLDIISHNLANATTGGFKRDFAVTRGFVDQLDRQFSGLSATAAASDNSVPELTVETDFSQGAFSNTGNPLDVAIEGDGYFELHDGRSLLYSRQGGFQLDAAGRLVSSEGLVVNGLAGEIRLTTTTPRIDKQGMVWDGDDAIAQLKLVRFSNPGALIKHGNGSYRMDGNLRAQPLLQPSLRQGFVETSNVDVMQEMVKMMTTVRHFEATQQVIRGYDEILGTAIQTIAEF